jgi:glycine/D-amino acid oxidase-like deaminating enzyme
MKYSSPPWDREIDKPHFPALDGDIQADVLIIGGGMAGLLNAYRLSEQGLKVVLAEKGELFSGVTGLTTAFLTQSIDTDTPDLIHMLGEEGAQRVLESHAKAVDLIEEIADKESIECEFVRCSGYMYAESGEDNHILEDEYHALLRLGVDVHLFMAGDADLGFAHAGYVEICSQAKFHPLKFASGLAQVLSDRGVQIFENTEIEEVKAEGETRVARTPHGSISASWIVSATYEPFHEPIQLFFKKGMYVSYVMELEVSPGLIGEGIYEDTDNPYHYFRIDPKGKYDRMIIGGEDNKEIFPVDEEKHFSTLEDYVKKMFPALKYKIVYRWSGPILEPSDGLAFIGSSRDDRVMYAFGFSGNGMTYSAISAMIISDLIAGKDNPYFKLYDASRWMRLEGLAIKAKDYTEEFIRGAAKDAFKKKKKE